MDIAARITYFREKRGYTVNKLANLAGISQSFLRGIERSQHKPSIETLSFLCDALNISLRDFFDDTVSQSEIDPGLLHEIALLTPQQQKTLSKFLQSSSKR